jgi:hypothetical protein
VAARTISRLGGEFYAIPGRYKTELPGVESGDIAIRGRAPSVKF